MNLYLKLVLRKIQGYAKSMLLEICTFKIYNCLTVAFFQIPKLAALKRY